MVLDRTMSSAASTSSLTSLVATLPAATWQNLAALEEGLRYPVQDHVRINPHVDEHRTLLRSLGPLDDAVKVADLLDHHAVQSQCRGDRPELNRRKPK